MLVSWDVVAMFPNIDNDLGIKPVRNALETRAIKDPPRECIVEAVEICLISNNSQFNDTRPFCAKTPIQLWNLKMPVAMPI